LKYPHAHCLLLSKYIWNNFVFQYAIPFLVVVVAFWVINNINFYCHYFFLFFPLFFFVFPIIFFCFYHYFFYVFPIICFYHGFSR
jgi:hypothetical protein